MNILVNNWWKEIDQFNFFIVITLMVIGTILSFSINYETLFYFKRHLIYVFASVILIIIVSYLEPKTLRRLAVVGLIISTGLMISILLMNYEVNGSKRWIRLWQFNLQPSEFLKPFFLLVSAWFLSKGIEGQKIALYIVFTSFLILTSLLILQPDFGMTILFVATFFCQLFIAGLSITLIIFAFFLIILLSIFSYFTLDHVRKRIDMFFDPNIENYQITQSLNAFKSGGIFGKGPGQGILKEKIPDAYNDFIFSVAGEEFGFILCCLIILLFLVFIIRNLIKLLNVDKPYIINAVVGLVSCFGLQVFINISSSLDIIPTKGMTLPLISYGGSSMLSSAILVGFLLSLLKIKK